MKGNKERNCTELSKIQKERERKVYKADDMIQSGRYGLTINEQRLILFVISHIKPTDTEFTEYVFHLKDFKKICGINENDSYTTLKKHCKNLSDKSWWIMTKKDGKRCETLVRWFNTLDFQPNSDEIRLKFHERMMPYLLELAKRYNETGTFYTSYELQYILPMRSKHSIRLYELLKSYIKNKTFFCWQFEIKELKRLLDCENYNRYPDFRRRVLELASKEINKYSDLNIYYTTNPERTKSHITFIINRKNGEDLMNTLKNNQTCLDGNIHYWDLITGEQSQKEDSAEGTEH